MRSCRSGNGNDKLARELDDRRAEDERLSQQAALYKKRMDETNNCMDALRQIVLNP